MISIAAVAYRKGGTAERRAPSTVHGATARIRTADLLITNQLLYQLSYGGTTAPS